MNPCPSCGAPVPDVVRFCTHCGTSLADTSPDDTAVREAIEPPAGPFPPAVPPPLPPPRPLFVDEVTWDDEPPTLASQLLGPVPPDPYQPDPYQPDPYQPDPYQSASYPPGPATAHHDVQVRRRRRGPLVAAGVALVLALGVGGGFAVATLMGGGDPDPAPAAATTDPDAGGSTGANPDEGTAPSDPGPGPSERTGPPPVGRLEAGLRCADLQGRGYDFVAADRYWNLHGRPALMDADVNGIPCETKYPVEAIRDVYGARVDTATTDATKLGSGLGCATLLEFGVDYPAVMEYWTLEGEPKRLDRNGDGTPCDESYPQAS